MIKLLGVAAVLLPAAFAAGEASAQPRGGKPVFSCAFGAKQALVTGAPPSLTYRFGTVANAEMTVVGSPGARNVFQKRELFPRAVNTHLRFANGPVSYVLFHRVYFGTATHKGAEDRQGLLVLKGGKLLAKMTCKTGPGFGDADLSSLPEDDAFVLADHM